MSEKASKESKKKIDETLKKAAIDVNNILKEDNIANIDASIEDDWDDI